MAFPVSPNIGDTHTEDDTLWTYGSNGWYSTIIGDANDTRYTCGPSLGSLNDVDLDPAPSNGDALVYDSATDTWIPGAGGGGGSATPAGSAGEIQFNDGGSPAQLDASPDLLWDDVNKELEVGGDVVLDDGGTFTTTLQTVTPTQNRTISFPDATGTVGLVAGSSGQVVYNNAGAYAGVPSSVIGATGNITLSLNGATGVAPVAVTGTWFAGTTPQVLIQPSNVGTAGAWSASGTGIGVNAVTGFGGNLLDLQVNGSSLFKVGATGTSSTSFLLQSGSSSAWIPATGAWALGGSSGSPGLVVEGALGTGLTSSAVLWWGSSTTGLYSSRDVVLARDAANTLAQRNAANAQTFRVYGTFTDASNHVRASLSSTSTAVTLAAETAGTGADDIPLNLTAAGTGTVKVNSVAEVVVSSTVAGLPAAPVVGMLTRVTDATAPAVGSTVTGGGAAAALVWYNGANWSVIGV
jgi:hypothetical protein